MYRWLHLGIAPFLLASAAYGQKATPCADLAKLNLPHTKVVLAEEVAAGQFVPPGDAPSPADAAIYKHIPAFCRVAVEASPTPASEIKIEVWLPLNGMQQSTQPAPTWNSKFRGQGNGGFAGDINYSLLALSVSQGYATAGTDTGHSTRGAAWALNQPEKIIDFGYRGIHEMTTNAKAIIDAYYGKPAARSYFASCSDGGREALMEAQRFPEDYDGILAGAPAYIWTNLLTAGMHKTQTLLSDPASYISPAKLATISSSVLDACDAADGVKDGVVSDPRTCHFKPETLACTGSDSNSCLTPPQVAILKSIYSPTLDSSGKQIYPRGLPGGELGSNGWVPWIFGAEPGRSQGAGYGIGYFSNMVYDDPHWDFKTFTVDDGLTTAIAKTAKALNATDPNLKPFSSRGGKLILYHGWNDPAISPLSTIDYYQQVQQANSNADSFVRLFLVPGMQHCYAGPGASSFGQFGWRPGTGPDDVQHDIYRALEQWVDGGMAPEQVIAAKIESDGKSAPKLTMTRPVCAYPKEPKYNGSGDTSDAANFSCR
jgi:hypothetical protein